MSISLLLAVLGGIGILLFLILVVKIQAFLSLLIASISVGLFAGMEPQSIINTVTTGMGNTLGYVATVVGLGVIFGAILEHCGGAKVIAKSMVGKLGVDNAPLAMVISGFIVAIPVFFEVAFIILIPIVYALQQQTGKSLLLYAIPLLAGLAVTHAFIPPTPGPIAVASIVGADLGWVIFLGFIVGLPTALVSGLVFGKYISNKMFIEAPAEFLEDIEEQDDPEHPPALKTILTIIGFPILLILINTTITSSTAISGIFPPLLLGMVELLGHPITALIIANLLAWYILGIKRGESRQHLADISTKSMMPAGSIILITGAGGVFKQMLIDTGAGTMIAEAMAEYGIPVLLLAFLAAVVVRLLQGSATVAMITAAGLVAPLIEDFGLGAYEMATVVLAIAAGASIFSHVNDSGFWLVNQYLGLSEKETFKSWTVMTGLVALVGFACIWIVSLVPALFG